jgi:3' terminal RNA ribose 2'-O-methyltransferase Hen1
MLLNLTTTFRPATDLGFLLRKNPGRPQSSELSFGKAHVFYPEASLERCTCSLLVEVDPVALVRRRRGPSGEGGVLDQYVNDRPYTASSFLSVAIADVFGSAISGSSKDRPELVDQPLPLELELPVVPCKDGESLIRRLFEPLGHAVSATRLPLDGRFPEWGESRYFRLKLSAVLPLRSALSHLYVLLPVLDNDKHYWVGDDEVQKLLRHGEGWLSNHPEKELITRRYLKHQRSLFTDALEQLRDESDPAPDETATRHAAQEADIERPLKLNDQRLTAVHAALPVVLATRPGKAKAKHEWLHFIASRSPLCPNSGLRHDGQQLLCREDKSLQLEPRTGKQDVVQS